MILYAPNARDVLSRNPKRPALIIGPNGPVQMNDPVLDYHVVSQLLRPRLVLEFGNEPLADRCVIDVLGRLCFQSCQALKQVGARYNADELAVLQHRDALDPMPIKYFGDLCEGCRLLYADDVFRHDVPRRAAMRFRVLPGRRALVREKG